MKEHPSYPWDHFSDQPRIIRDKKLKRKIYLRASIQMLKSALLLPLTPFFVVLSRAKQSWQPSKTKDCIGLSVHVESACEGKTIVPLHNVKEMVDDLGVQQILVRIPLSDAEHFDTYIQHIDTLSKDQREISVNIIQDRFMLDNPDLLQATLLDLLTRLKDRVTFIHVGNAYNRRKWAFYHFGEYHRFFQAVRAASQEVAPNLKLIGGSVIDFELPPLLESMYHLRGGHYDGYSSQLYVDRRGAPENKQLGFNFLSKINFIDTLRQFSWKVKGPLWISEFNWPLCGTGKFPPCKGSALVDEQTQANFLTRAYLIAMASGKIRTCFWHQLIAPGYGLVDNRGSRADGFIKRPSYYAFKTLNTLFGDAEIIDFKNGNFANIDNLYFIKALTSLNGENTTVCAYWSNSDDHETLINLPKADSWMDQYGNPLSFSATEQLKLTASVIYSITQS